LDQGQPTKSATGGGTAEPQRIWLPNAIVDGAADETPPLRLLRQMQDVRRLRLFVAMYDSHDLANDGGISRTVLSQKHTLTKEGSRGAWLKGNAWQASLRLLRAWDVISLTDKKSVFRHLHGQ
jgi:hypothetical protein